MENCGSPKWLTYGTAENCGMLNGKCTEQWEPVVAGNKQRNRNEAPTVPYIAHSNEPQFSTVPYIVQSNDPQFSHFHTLAIASHITHQHISCQVSFQYSAMTYNIFASCILTAATHSTHGSMPYPLLPYFPLP
ncbi:hypothetical protein AVEN_142979-1 [Araneus ventricosus]|uniref:Uncharacterized protein n=1 Tax=Araneus ventricosus TaxID=182803 RepID=A0A4Y2PRS6_ARAVE|nr:hypothetical protein AVEN_142979-1 [Araneus ventricosus]